jgi:hypothetical protein
MRSLLFACITDLHVHFLQKQIHCCQANPNKTLHGIRKYTFLYVNIYNIEKVLDIKQIDLYILCHEQNICMKNSFFYNRRSSV